MNTSTMLERAKQFLSNRKAAFERVFNKENNDAVVVLDDLSKFCRAHESTFHPDPHMAARLDGRREVWLRIEQHLNLTDEQLWKLYSKAE